MPEIELFTSNLSPYAHRVRLALLEKKIDFWHTEIDLANKPEWFLVIAPLGEVPVIRHEDRFISDSTVILEYSTRSTQRRRFVQRTRQSGPSRASG